MSASFAMNSANGLYIAFRVPDATVNDSLVPIKVDFASLAFCRGKELSPGDDRKMVVPGLYVDKHFTAPGKDADDSHQDGRGAMALTRESVRSSGPFRSIPETRTISRSSRATPCASIWPISTRFS